MKIIAGLGNPGQEYAHTRHNVGFFVVDELARRWGAAFARSRHEALVAERGSGSQRIFLMKPQTYMNLSGVAVGGLARFYKIAAEDLIVVYDDIDLPPGRLRIRQDGGPGGHRGVESLIVHLGSESFVRVRVGVGRPPAGIEAAGHVLRGFLPQELPVMRDAVTQAADAVEAVLSLGVVKAANRFNKKEKPERPEKTAGPAAPPVPPAGAAAGAPGEEPC